MSGEERLTAIKAIGSNAVPTLLKFIAASDMPFKTKIISFLNRQKVVRCHIHTAEEKRRYASGVFEQIGPHPLIPAIPGLIQLTKHKNAKVRETALQCLSTVHTDKSTFLPVLTDRLSDSDKSVRQLAAYFMQRRFPDDAEQAGLYQVFPAMKPQVTTNYLSRPSLHQTR